MLYMSPVCRHTYEYLKKLSLENSTRAVKPQIGYKDNEIMYDKTNDWYDCIKL